MTTTTKGQAPSLAPETAKILEHLYELAGMDQKERADGDDTADAIATDAGLEQGSVVGRLNGLARKGLVALNTRDQTWTITPAGEQHIAEHGDQPLEDLKAKTQAASDGPRRTAEQLDREAAQKASAVKTRGPREGSAMHAAITVLKTAKEPLTAEQIYERASRRDLLKTLKGKTPIATIAAQMAVHAKAGRYFKRTSPGHYQLREGVK